MSDTVPTIYTYSRTDDMLAVKIGASVGVPPLSVETGVDGTVLVTMPSDLTPDLKAGLDGFMSTRSLVPASGNILLATACIIPKDTQISDPSGYELLGGIVTNPSFFSADIGKSFGLLVASVRTVGLGARLRITEDNAGKIRVLGEFDLDDTGGVWRIGKYPTLPPDASLSEMTYSLEGTLGKAAEAAIRFTSLSLMQNL